MMSFDFKYYRIFNGIANIPRLARRTRPSYLYIGEKVENPESVLLGYVFKSPVPRKPIMADFHSTPRTVFSNKIYKVLAPLNISTIQFLPAVIENEKKERYENYWGLNILKSIKCLDKKMSKLDDDGYGISNVKKIVLDKKILREIPLDERLIFMLGEHSYDLFHHLIVEKIMIAKPIGIKFVNFEDITDTYHFEN